MNNENNKQPLIVFVLGPTGSGKTTFIDYATELSEHVGSVRVGKILNERYKPEHFKGKGNPTHTSDEARDLCKSLVAQHIANNKRIILVDGQPRDIKQVYWSQQFWRDTPRIYTLFTANIETRKQRLIEKYGDSELLRTQKFPRLERDMQDNYEVLTRLLALGIMPTICDTTHLNAKHLCETTYGHIYNLWRSIYGR